MKVGANCSTGSTGRWRLLSLCLLLPFLMGGCPEFRDDIVGVAETATRSAFLGAEDRDTIAFGARTSIVDATIDLFFDQFRSDRIN